MKPSKLFLLFLLAMMAFTTKAQEGAWSGSLDVLVPTALGIQFLTKWLHYRLSIAKR